MRKYLAHSLLLAVLSVLASHGATAQSMSQADLQLLQAEWTLDQTLNKDGLELPMPEGPRDRFHFKPDNSLTVFKKAQSADANYKVSLSNGELYIADKVSGRTIKYFIKEVDKKRLVLYYPDELKGSKTLIFTR